MAFNPSKYTRRGNSPSSGPSRGPMASMDAARAAARAGNMGAPRATQAGGQAPSGRNPELQRASAGMDAARARQQSRTGGAPGGHSTMNPGMMEAIKARQAGGMPPPGGGGMMNMQMPGFRGQVGGTPGGPSTMNPGGAPGGAPSGGGMPPPGGASMRFKKGGKTEAKKAPSGITAKGYGKARGAKVCKVM